MSRFARGAVPNWLKPWQGLLVVASLALMFPSASGATVLDSVTATTTGNPSPFAIGFANVNISAESTPSGGNPSGTVSFTVLPYGFNLSGPVTCMSVTGPDRGAGTAAMPTTAVLNFQSAGAFAGINTVQLTDNGGNGADVMLASPTGRAPNDCSPLSAPSSALTNGRAVVFDAPVVPSSKAQCTDGGWRDFAQFKNQGDCIGFVETGR